MAVRDKVDGLGLEDEDARGARSFVGVAGTAKTEVAAAKAARAKVFIFLMSKMMGWMKLEPRNGRICW
jgi:hypothetical protein